LMDSQGDPRSPLEAFGFACCLLKSAVFFRTISCAVGT
jgi:hypothetical protein